MEIGKEIRDRHKDNIQELLKDQTMERRIMRTITRRELNDILRKHRLWLEGYVGGAKADLSYVDLRLICLGNASLQRADMRGSNLQMVNLQGADLEGADLEGADLRGADLRDACLQGANLRNIKVDYKTVGIHPAPEGDLIGWGKKNGIIVKLLIPKEANRSCATTRRYRAEFATVLDVESKDQVAIEYNYGLTIYKPGKTVRCRKWDPNRWNTYGDGIHFFLSREEAKSY